MDETSSGNFNFNFNEQLSNSLNALTNNSNNLDRGLYNDLVQIVPLVQSLIESEANRSFTRRVPVIYTKAPKEPRKNGIKSKNDLDGASDKSAAFSAKIAAEKDREDLNAVRAQLEDLQQKLFEKDELLEAAEVYKNQMSSVQSKVDELKLCANEKDSLIKSNQSQLNDAKVKLADKQAALEKLQWETKTSNQKVENLQEELVSTQSQISSLMLIFEGLFKDAPFTGTEDYDVAPDFADDVADIDNLDEIEMQNMEEAREAYLAALEIAKKKQDEEFEEALEAASRARHYLQSLVFRPSPMNLIPLEEVLTLEAFGLEGGTHVFKLCT